MSYDFGQVNPVTLAPATLKAIARIRLGHAQQVTVTVAVAAAPLDALEVWARGDAAAPWQPIATTAGEFIEVSGLDLAVRTDNVADLTTTPAGQAATFSLNCLPWSDIEVRAKSPGAAVLTVTAGIK